MTRSPAGWVGRHPAPAALAVLAVAVLLPLWATLTAAR